MIRRISIGVISSLLSLVIFTTLFSVYSDFSPESAIDGIFLDIYENANPASQQKALQALSSQCEALGALGEDGYEEQIADYKDLCSDAGRQEELMQQCASIDDHRGLYPSEVLAGFEQTCTKLVSGELLAGCNSIPEASPSSYNEACLGYNSGRLSRGEFFQAILSGLVPEGSFDTEQSPLFRILDVFDIITNLFVPLVAILVIILALLHVHRWKEFFLKLGNISLNLGILILIPYLILKIYVAVVGVDTGFILDSISSGVSDVAGFQALKVILPILLLKSYTAPLLVAGVIFFCIGLALWIAFHKKHQKKDAAIEKESRDYIEKSRTEKQRSI